MVLCIKTIVTYSLVVKVSNFVNFVNDKEAVSTIVEFCTVM